MALLLRDVVGLSYTEIADSLEITLATVKWRIYKAREEVATALARDGITAEHGDEHTSRSAAVGADVAPRTGQPIALRAARPYDGARGRRDPDPSASLASAR